MQITSVQLLIKVVFGTEKLVTWMNYRKALGVNNVHVLQNY